MASDDFKIKKGIPIPRPHGGVRPNFPFAQMNVGESFDYPVPNDDVELARSRILNGTYWRQKKNPGEKYTTRAVLENDSRIIRCWRVA